MDTLHNDFNPILNEENTNNELTNEDLFIDDLDFIENPNFDASKLSLDEINEFIETFEN